jgi:uncharacterized protein
MKFTPYFFAPHFLLVWLAFCFTGASAQDGCPPSATAPTDTEIATLKKTAKDRGFLWRITKDGRASYLYGTLHISKLDWAFPGPQLTQAVLQTDIVALEVNVLDPQTLLKLSQGMQAASAQPLPAQLQARLARQASASCLSAAQIQNLRPEFQLMAITVMALKKQGLDPSYGADLVIASLANHRKKPIEALETVEAQLELLRITDTAQAIATLDEALAQLEAGISQAALSKVVQHWADNDYDALSSYASWCNCLNTDKERNEMKRLLDDRNLPMAQRIDAMHAKGQRIFAAVGALHMVGPTGLPALMTQRGYTLKRVF